MVQEKIVYEFKHIDKTQIVARNVYKIQVDILREVDDLFNIKFSLLFTNIELL